MFMPIFYSPSKPLHGLQLRFSLEPYIIPRMFVYVVVASPADSDNTSVFI